MKRILCVAASSVVCALLIGTAASAAERSWDFILDPSQVRTESLGHDRLWVAVPGYETLEYVGYPALPYRVVSILVPQNETISSYRLDVLDEQRMPIGAPLALFTGLARDDGTRGGAVGNVSEIGTDGAIFPAWQVRYLGSGYYRGYRIATFALYPVRYDRQHNELVVSKGIRLVLDTEPSGPSVDCVERERRIKGFREESRRTVERLVMNPDAAASYVFDDRTIKGTTKAFLPSYEPSMEGSDVACLIVTNESMAPAFQRLADWKTTKGVPAVVRTVEWIGQHCRSGADLAETVRNFIKDAYARWGVEWVILGGDTDVIPARYGFVRFPSGQLVPTDMYFACLDGTWNADGDSLWGEAYYSVPDPGDEADLYAEVYIGRMPASSLSEAEILVDKTIDYSTSADTTSKKKALMLAQILFPSPYYPGDSILVDGAEMTESIYNAHYNGNPDVITTRLYQNAAEYPGSLSLTKEAAIDSLNAGANHVLYAGHGSYYNMSVGGQNLLNYDAANLSNGQALFSLYIMSCQNVAFDTDCLAESFLLNANGGAYAAIGSSRPSYPSASRPYMDEYYHQLFELDAVQIGKAFTRSREPFTPYAAAETADRLTHFLYNYLGDPEVCTFRGRGEAFVVSKPSSAHFGANDILIEVTSNGAPFDSALVCLYKQGDDYEYALTGPTGVVLFDDFLCNSGGDITVTVTGLDHYRYTGFIPVTQSASQYLRTTATAVDDAIVGNHDGKLDAGETVDLRVKLKNTGQTTASKLYAIVRSFAPEVVVIDSTAVYPIIPAGAEAWGNDAFRFSVSSSVTDEHPIEFTIDVRDSTGGFWPQRFALDVHAPAVELFVMAAKDTLPYGDNDGVIENGESFRLKIGVKNFGSGAAYGLHGTIRSLDVGIAVGDSLSTYGSLSTLGLSYGDGFVLSETDTSGVNYFSFELVDAYGRTLTRRLELRKPGAPKGLVLNSTYGPHEIEATWNPPDDLDAYRYLVYHSLSSGGPFTLASADLVLCTQFRDYGLLGSTRYYYVVTAVDSCGNQGPMSAEATATTNPAMLPSWPQTVGKEPSSSVKIGDIDGDTHPDVVVGSDYIYAWHADGIELRDGDNEPLTWGVFSNLGDTYTATVALADLDGVRGLEIIGASWNTKQIYVLAKDGSVLPGWPQSTASLCWASPVVGDIDGDGAPEIIAYSVAGVVYAWNVDGTEVRNGDNNPATNGPFFVTKNPGTWHLSTPALADMDEDGVVELIVCSPNDSIYCINGDGRRVAGWPISVIDAGTNVTASPAVGDVDGDGHLEVAIQNSAGRVFLLNRSGAMMSGWPKWVPSNTSTIAPSPALADLDGDGKLEIVIAGLDSKCYVFRHTGTSYPGWPQTYTESTVNKGTESSPVVGDIDGDGSLDIVLGCEDGQLHAWKSNGERIAGFPILINAYLRGTPMLCDLDLDGTLELATSCWDQNIYIWKLTGGWRRDCVAWNGFHANICNTGWKDYVPVTGVSEIECSYRFIGHAIQLSWNVAAGMTAWNLYRESDDDGFVLVASRLCPEPSGVVSYVDGTTEEGGLYRYRLEAADVPELSSTTQRLMVPVQGIRLHQNHPNPFNPLTVVPFAVPGDGHSTAHVTISVYDVDGKLVKTLVDADVPAGKREARWDGRNNLGERVASGVYFIRMNVGSKSASIKSILLR